MKQNNFVYATAYYGVIRTGKSTDCSDQSFSAPLVHWVLWDTKIEFQVPEAYWG